MAGTRRSPRCCAGCAAPAAGGQLVPRGCRPALAWSAGHGRRGWRWSARRRCGSRAPRRLNHRNASFRRASDTMQPRSPLTVRATKKGDCSNAYRPNCHSCFAHRRHAGPSCRGTGASPRSRWWRRHCRRHHRAWPWRCPCRWCNARSGVCRSGLSSARVRAAAPGLRLHPGLCGAAAGRLCASAARVLRPARLWAAASVRPAADPRRLGRR